MSITNFEQARLNMVEQQVRPWDVLNRDVLETISTISRQDFIPSAYQNLAYADTAIPLNDEESMMHPILEGRLLQALDIQPNDEILEIGTGSAYLSACMAHLGSHVDSYEIDAQLAENATATLKRLHIYNVNVINQDAVQDFTSRKTYNAIAVTGSINEAEVNNYKHMLATGGRLFVITGNKPAMVARSIVRESANSWSDKIIFETSIKALKNMQKINTFSF